MAHRPFKHLRPFVPSDDVQGKLRDEIIQEHMKWQEAGCPQDSEKDFSEAPIARWAKENRIRLAQRRVGSSGAQRPKKRN